MGKQKILNVALRKSFSFDGEGGEKPLRGLEQTMGQLHSQSCASSRVWKPLKAAGRRSPRDTVATNPIYGPPVDSGSLRCEAAKSPGLGDRGSLSWYLSKATDICLSQPDPQSTSVCNMGGLRTFSMTWKQNFKTNSLPFLSSSAPVWKVDVTKGQTKRDACGSKGAALPQGSLARRCRCREGGLSPQGRLSQPHSRHICSDHSLSLVQTEPTCSQRPHTTGQDGFSAHTLHAMTTCYPEGRSCVSRHYVSLEPGLNTMILLSEKSDK